MVLRPVRPLAGGLGLARKALGDDARKGKGSPRDGGEKLVIGGFEFGHGR